jgi:flagellar hook protein FlgE
MVSSIQSNTSALRAFGNKVAVSANNVANSLSDDFKKSRALNSEGAKGQVKTVITKIDTPGPRVEDPLSTTGELKELSNTDIAEEMTNQITASHGFSANAEVIKTHEEITGTLLNLIG